MNALQGPRSFSTTFPERGAIPVDLEVVCLWSALGLILTALFFALGCDDIGRALILIG